MCKGEKKVRPCDVTMLNSCGCQEVYIRIVRPQLLYNFGTFESFLAFMQQMSVQFTCCPNNPLTNFRQLELRAYCPNIFIVLGWELAPLEAFSSTRELSLIAVGTRGQGEPCPPYTLKYQLTQSEGGWGTVCPSHYYFTLGLFMLRSFKIQPDEVMNLSNCYFFGY